MDIDKIIEELQRRFTEPLQEYYQRRIIFWYDQDEEFKDKIDAIHLENVKIITLCPENTFMVKKLLAHDDLTSNYLVYTSMSFDDSEQDWLLGIKLYSEEFRADLISIWMTEMGITSSISMRNEMKRLRKFFNAKDRRAKIVKQNKVLETPGQLHLAVMAALCGLREASPNNIIMHIIQEGMDADINKLYTDFANYGVKDSFWEMVKQGTGYQQEDKNIAELAKHIMLTAAARTLPLATIIPLQKYISESHEAYCYDFVSSWLHSNDNGLLYDIAVLIGNDMNLARIISNFSLDELKNTECFPCVDEIILDKLMSEINNDIVNTEVIRKVIERRRTCIWYDKFEDYYEGLWQVTNMYDFYMEHANGFNLAQTRDVWKAYTEDYYKMDSYYRQFHLSFQRSLEEANDFLDDHFKGIVEKVENLYTYKFLGDLGANWNNVCADELEKYGYLVDIPQQTNFYEQRVQNADSRVFVIISDAFRYEVAASLTEELRQEGQCDVNLHSMQGIFPTITKFGMAALLPHKKLSLEVKNDQLKILADGKYTDSGERENVLKNRKEKSVALKYKDLINDMRAERLAKVKGKAVIYIYHDVIDESSHTSDTAVFPACEKAIRELKNMVHIIINDFGGTKIFITADHGFLYTYKPLQEDTKLDKAYFKGMDVEYGRRYAIMNKEAKPEYLIPVNLLNGNTDYMGFAPRESIRLKMNGGGLNFVHGGISLQEMVVPLIEFHHLRNAYKKYKTNKQKYDVKPVTITLTSSSHKLSNMIFGLNFYQNEPVGGNRSAASYKLYFVDEYNNPISDTQRIIADKDSNVNGERTFRCNFNLKPLKYSNTDNYYLVIEDEQGLQLPQREKFQIDIACAVDDFHFFD